jgi:hypothetical protein
MTGHVYFVVLYRCPRAIQKGVLCFGTPKLGIFMWLHYCFGLEYAGARS